MKSLRRGSIHYVEVQELRPMLNTHDGQQLKDSVEALASRPREALTNFRGLPKAENMTNVAPHPVSAPFAGYRALTPETVREHLAGVPAAVAILGGSGRPVDWRAREVGDGNLNLVFIVEGPGGSLVAKQALPYVRLVGESWPLPLERSLFEHAALTEQARHVGRLVPAVHHFDPGMALIVMERLQPHVILRKGLTAGVVYPRLAADAAEFLAQTLFHTSDLYLPAAEKRRRAAFFNANTALCQITEDLVFTDPYRVAEGNRWTSPQLDDLAAELRADAALKVAVQRLKWRFLTRAEAMVHGDLHTGSIMATPEDTRVIDPEFAFYGPMGFDVGALVANLFLAYFAQAGHEGSPGSRDAYREWLLAQVPALWEGFAQRFLELWRAPGHHGDAYPAGLFADPDGGGGALEAERRAFLRRVFVDGVGFAGAKMIRRIFGLAHVEDLESIADPDRRAACERPAVAFARRLLLDAAGFPDAPALNALARGTRAAFPSP